MNRNNKKDKSFTLANIITLLSASVCGVVCFHGKNFNSLANMVESVVWAAGVAGLLAGTALGARTLKRKSRNLKSSFVAFGTVFKTSFIFEIILVVLFAVFSLYLALSPSSPFTHYFTVTERRTEIREKLAENITQAENMFAEYERYAQNRKNLYEQKLRSVARAKNTRPSEYALYFENNRVADANQIENIMSKVHENLFPSRETSEEPSLKTNYEAAKHEDSTWLAKRRTDVENWILVPFMVNIADVVNQVEPNSMKWRNELIQISEVRNKGEIADDFDFNLSFEDVIGHFIQQGTPTEISCGLAFLLTFVLMLLWWVVTKREAPGFIKMEKDEIIL